MSFTQPLNIGQRITYIESPECLVIKIYTPKRYDILTVLAIIVFGWVYIFSTILTAQFTLNLVCFAIGVGSLPLYAFSWGMFGREIIRVSKEKIAIKQDVFGMGFRQTYQQLKITNMHVSPTNPTMFSLEKNLEIWGVAGGSVAFNYIGKLCRFGLLLSKEDANELIAKIREFVSIPD